MPKNRNVMGQPAVAVVLLNWNGWRDTLACLASLVELHYSDYTPIVVDNGSTDDSLREIRQAYPNVDLIEVDKNIGFSGGCNAGIRKALEDGAEYIWLLNNDAVADSDSLDEMVSMIEASSELGAIGCVVKDLEAPHDVQAWGGGRVNMWTGINRNVIVPVDADHLSHLYGASMLIRSSALRDVGLLDSTRYFLYWEENDLCVRLKRNGWKLGVCNRAIIYHKGSASIEKNSPLKYRYFSYSAVRFFGVHAPVPLIPIVASAVRRCLHLGVTGQFNVLSSVLAGYREGLRDLTSRKGLVALFKGDRM